MSDLVSKFYKERIDMSLNLVFGFCAGIFSTLILGCYTGAIASVAAIISKDVILMLANKFSFNDSINELAGIFFGVVAMTAIMSLYAGDRVDVGIENLRVKIDPIEGIYFQPRNYRIWEQDGR